MTFLEFISTWDHTMTHDEWRAAFLVFWIVFLVAVFK